MSPGLPLVAAGRRLSTTRLRGSHKGLTHFRYLSLKTSQSQLTLSQETEDPSLPAGVITIDYVIPIALSERGLGDTRRQRDQKRGIQLLLERAFATTGLGTR